MASTQVRGDYGISDHYVICNWSNKADTIIRQLHHKSIINTSPIIIITEKPERIPVTTDPEYRGVLTIIGDPASKEILQRADVGKAKAVIILADDENLEEADSKAILIALAIDSISASVHVIVELINSQNKLYFNYTHANEIVCIEEVAQKILAQAALTPGLSKVYIDLLTQSEDTNEIYQEPVPKYFIGKTYSYMEQEIVKIDEKDVILIGFSTLTTKKDEDGVCIKDSYGNCITERKVIINPMSSRTDIYSKSHIMEPDDTIFIIAYEKPNLNEYFIAKNIKNLDLNTDDINKQDK